MWIVKTDINHHSSGETPLLSWPADNVTHCNALRTLSHIVKTNIGDTLLLSWPADNMTHREVKESNVNCENQHQPYCSGDLERLCSSRDPPTLDFLYSPPTSQPPQLHTGGKPQQLQKQQLLRIRRPADEIYWSSKSDGWSRLLVLLRVECQRLSSGLKKLYEDWGDYCDSQITKRNPETLRWSQKPHPEEVLVSWNYLVSKSSWGYQCDSPVSKITKWKVWDSLVV